MPRKPLALLLGPDPSPSTEGTQAVRLERFDRERKQMLGCYIDSSLREQFRHLAGELRRTNAELLREAIHDLLNKYGKRP